MDPRVRGAEPISDVAELLAIAALSSAVLLFETLITRVLSVTIHYHFAFLAISLAMLGLGAPGVWFSLRPPGPRALTTAAFASALAIPASIVAIVKLGAIWQGSTTLVVLALLLPLLALGSGVCVLLVRARGARVARVYAADLLGAALGALAAIPLLDGLPTPPLVAALAFLPLFAVAVTARRAPRTLAVAGALGVLLVGLLAWGRPLRLRYTKRYTETIAPLYEKWSSTARVTVLPIDALGQRASGFDAGYFGWGMGSRFVPPRHEGLWLDQDGSAGTPILRWSRDEPVPPYLYFDVTSLAYQLGRPLDRVAIIGGGGGRDVLTAYGAGARAIDVFELNPYIVAAVRRNFGLYSGDPYGLPGVRVVVGEGRASLEAREARYDLVQLSLIDTFAATAAGAYALSENGLYTVEALRLYLRRLTPTGVVSISRWAGGAGRLEAPRLALLAQQALAEEGVADPRAHLLVVQAGIVANVLVSAAPIDAALVAKADEVSARRGFVRVWPPPPGAPPSAVAAALIAGAEPFARGGFDVTPPTDDRPFFFQTTDLLSPPPAEVRARLGGVDPALVLRRVLLLLTVVTAALLFAPLALRRRWAGGSRRLGRATGYFAAIGVAFMLVEVPLVLRMTLYLGHPSRGAALVLGALLLGAGLGSMRVAKLSERKTMFTLVLLPFVALAVAIALGPATASTLAAALPLRVSLAALVLVPLGVVMGAAFPAGMLRFDDVDRSWCWAVNGGASVLASALALAGAIAFGLTVTMVLGGLGYLVAVLVWLRSGTTREVAPAS